MEKVTLPAGEHAAKGRMHGHHEVIRRRGRRQALAVQARPRPTSSWAFRADRCRCVSWGSTPAALVTYGQNLGGIAVIEQAAKTGAGGQMQGGPAGGLNLPTVSINGATGHELDTALGTHRHVHA